MRAAKAILIALICASCAACSGGWTVLKQSPPLQGKYIIFLDQPGQPFLCTFSGDGYPSTFTIQSDSLYWNGTCRFEGDKVILTYSDGSTEQRYLREFRDSNP